MDQSPSSNGGNTKLWRAVETIRPAGSWVVFPLDTMVRIRDLIQKWWIWEWVIRTWPRTTSTGHYQRFTQATR